MQVFCHKCGEELPSASGESPFCPNCGSPQLYLSLENQSVETGGEPQTGADGTPTTGTLPPPRPRQVEWKTAIRCAVLVAGIGSALTLVSLRVDVLSPVRFIWILFASLITLGLYQKRRPTAWMDVRVGAHIGLVVGLCMALGLCLSMAGWGLVARFGLHTMGGFDAQVSAQLAESLRQAQQIMAARSMPAAPEMMAMEKAPEFRGWYALFYCAFLSMVLVTLSMVGGAIGGMLRTRRGPVA